MMIILRDSLHSTNSENKDNDISVSLFELVRRKKDNSFRDSHALPGTFFVLFNVIKSVLVVKHLHFNHSNEATSQRNN